MHLLFICAASVEVGFGHLIRALTLAQAAKESSYSVRFFCISSDRAVASPRTDVDIEIVQYEDDIFVDGKVDFVVFDLLTIDDHTFDRLALSAAKSVSLSPIFNLLDRVSIVFHRSSYGIEKFEQVTYYCGLEYSIVRRQCTPTTEVKYLANLDLEQPTVAVAMGGTDSENLTKRTIEVLNAVASRLTIYVVLGAGYKYSIDDLISRDEGAKHDFVFIRSDERMWPLLQDAVLGIFPGGITCYEAFHVGLPSIIVHRDPSRALLTKELIDEKVAIDGGNIELHDLKTRFSRLIHDKDLLLKMHRRCLSLQSSDSERRIFRILESHLSPSTK